MNRILIFVLLATFWSACNFSSGTLETSYSLMEESRYEEAKVVLLDVIKTDSTNGRAYKALIETYRQLGQNDQVLQILDQWMGVDRGAVTQALKVVRQFRDEGRYNEAITVVNKALALDTLTHLVLVDRARVYILLSEFEKADADIMEAIKIEPQCYEAFLARGMRYYGEGDLDKALDYFKAAEFLDGDTNAAAALYAGFVLSSSKINLDAIRKYTRAITIEKGIDPGYAYMNRGIALLNIGDTILACADFDTAQAYMPDKSREFIERYCGNIDKAAPGATSVLHE